ncbi:MAG: AGE family epimerase/isomerase [Agathobacter sp.]
MERISTKARRHLEQIILPFWKNLKDDEYGGFYGYMDTKLVLDKKAEKGCILNSRILWFFSEAAMFLKDEELKGYADHAYEFLRNHCLDDENGGIFWSMTYDGKPLDTTKHTYNQAFAIYALSSYYRLTGNQNAINTAKELFELIEKNCTDEIGYLESFTENWQPESNEKLSENGVMADKTMNTLLHVFEGYSGLYLATQDVEVRKALERIMDIYENKIYSPALRRQLVFFDKEYNSIIDLYSYGHDIESSWLIDWGCSLLQDEERNKRIFAINKEMAEAVYENAYRNHSLANECERGVVDTKRVWWVQAEAVLGFVNLWEKEPDSKQYYEAAVEIYRFIENYMVDKQAGSEWFWCTDENGVPNLEKPIVEPWKCPYHNGRMCMELMRKDPEIYV